MGSLFFKQKRIHHRGSAVPMKVSLEEASLMIDYAEFVSF